MANLPTAASLTGSAVTEAGFKENLSKAIDYMGERAATILRAVT